MRRSLTLAVLLLAGCARPPELPADHPASPAAPAGTTVAVTGLDDYLAPDALLKRAEAAAQAPAPRGHAGHGGH